MENTTERPTVNGKDGAENTEFSPPRHWIGVDELSSNYWSDPKVLERRSQEFHDKPIETISLIERLDTKGIARRDFLTIMGASMAMAATACARRPVNKIIPYVVQPEELTPGIANYYASVFPESGTGILIKTREGRPIKLEGNPNHPTSRGKLSARGQASILELYDPERLKKPISRTRGQVGATELSWSDVDGQIAPRLKAAVAEGKARVLSGQMVSDTSRKLVSELVGAKNHIEFEPLHAEDVILGQELSYGTAVMPRYRLDRAEVVVSLGSDFLESAGGGVEASQDWVKNRRLDSTKAASERLSKMFVFESQMSITGANADERFPVRPGDELKIALALCNAVGAPIAASKGFTLELVASEIGLDAHALEGVAKALQASRGKSLIIGGGSIASRTETALSLQLVINHLNSSLGNEGRTVDGTADADFRGAAGFSSIKKLIDDMNAGAVSALIIHRSNPLFTLPEDSGFAAALGKVGLVVTITDRDDETGLVSDFVLADHHFLENWGDSSVRRSFAAVQQPAISPLFDSRAFEDTILTWAKALGRGGALVASSKTWHDYLLGSWREGAYRQVGGGLGFDKFWENTLKNGGVQLTASREPSARSLRAASLAQVEVPKPLGSGRVLALYEMVAMHDGRSANNAWLQELPDPISSITWDNFLNVGVKAATELGVKQDDVVEITVGSIKRELAVNVQPGLHPQVVSAAVGYGRRRAGKVGDGAGVDVFPLVSVKGSSLVFSGQEVSLRKTGKYYRLAATQWHNASENRPIINDLSIDEWKANPAAENHTNPHLRLKTITMWKDHEYKGYRWGMSIDLNSCTGCGACVIACQAENNIPVVGRNNVRVSRQMHWIKIDRYYSGSPEAPETIFSPMLCQHCENAPCETVCPVLATVHDDEGTNTQAYNRCVGTRYCSNNCPYKVRRFNFFDHWKSYESTMNLVWNPDVTVRTRGIMEKCSFCIQRINAAKSKAKDEKRRVRDGDVLAACQQTCPTDAIQFGDINNKDTLVFKLQNDARAFRSLEILNTRPAISYLSKVRNRPPLKHGHDEHGGGHHG